MDQLFSLAAENLILPIILSFVLGVTRYRGLPVPGRSGDVLRAERF